MSIAGVRITRECDLCHGKHEMSGRDVPPGWVHVEFAGSETGVHPAARAMMVGLAEMLGNVMKMGPGSPGHSPMRPEFDVKMPSAPTAPLELTMDVCATCMGSDDQWLVLRRVLISRFCEQAEPLDIPAILGGPK